MTLPKLSEQSLRQRSEQIHGLLAAKCQTLGLSKRLACQMVRTDDERTSYCGAVLAAMSEAVASQYGQPSPYLQELIRRHLCQSMPRASAKSWCLGCG